MPFLLLLVLIVVYMPGKWPDPPSWLGGLGSVGAAWLAAAGMSAWAYLMARHFRRRLRGGPEERFGVVRRYAAWRKYHFIALLAVFLLVLCALGWGATVRTWGVAGSRMVPGLELLILAPFLTVLILSWAFYYSLERDLHVSGDSRGDQTFPSLGSYLSMQARHNFLLVFPPLLLMTLQQIILWVAPALASHWTYPLVSVGMLVALFLALPWLLILLLGLKPLPPGPLRSRLLAASQRLGLRCRDILLWNTRRGIANALVTGIIPRMRYVVVSDRLLSDLTPEEVEAVFGHEAGHLKHHHIPYYVAFFLISLVVIGSFWTVCSLWLYPEPAAAVAAAASSGTSPALAGAPADEAESILDTLPLIGLLAMYIFVVFGFLARRCERQADIFGCRTVSCGQANCVEHDGATVLVPRGRGLCTTGIRTFISALEKVADLNGISRSRPGVLSSWQHSTIARRVDFLERVSNDPRIESRFQRRVGIFKWCLLLGLLGMLTGLIAAVVSTGVSLQNLWYMLTL